MEKKDLIEGMKLYIYQLRVNARYSSAKSYQDALNSFKRFSGLETSDVTSYTICHSFVTTLK